MSCKHGTWHDENCDKCTSEDVEYQSGLRAGMLAAAEICEKLADEIGDSDRAIEHGMRSCEQAIREAATK